MKRKIIGWLFVLVMCVTLLSTTAYAADIASGDGWRLDGSGRLYITGSINGGGLGAYSAPWADYRNQVRFVYTSSGASVRDCRHLFYECENLKSADLSNLDTSKVTSMNFMFEGCNRLETVNLAGLDTSNVTSMWRMFRNCSSLSALDVTGFNTAKVTDMGEMFYGCSSLSSLDVTKFNTANVTDMSGMFERCSSLKTLDVSKFNTSNVTRMSVMFDGCKSLTKLDVSKFDTRNVCTFSAMFMNCNSLTALDVSGFDTSGATGFHNFMFYNCSSLTKLDVTGFDTSGMTEMAGMFSGCSSLQSLDLSHFDTANVWNMANMIYGCTNLKTLNLGKMNTSKVTDMAGMFEYCSSLTKLDISSFVISEETITNSMIKGCTALAEYGTSRDLMNRTVDSLIEVCPLWKNKADGVKYYGKKRLLSLYGKFTLVKDAGVDVEEYGPSWVLDKNGQLTIFGDIYGDEFKDVKQKIKTVVTVEGSMLRWGTRMFMDCHNLISADLSKLDTSNASYMSDMFLRCENLKEINLSGWDTKNVTDMGAMFCGCTSLKTLNLSSFVASNVTDMQSMFAGCENLESITLNYLQTSKLENTANMFSGCQSLRTIDMSKIYLGNARIILGMFENCGSLTSLDLSGLTTSSLDKAVNSSYTYELINGCYSLGSLKVNGTVLKKHMRLAYELFGISSSWYCSGVGTITKVDDLRGLSGTVTLTSAPTALHSGTGWWMDKNGGLHITGSVTNTSTSTGTEDKTPWKDYKSEITAVYTTKGASVNNCIGLFADCPNLKKAYLNNLNTNNVTSMLGMFMNCKSLQAAYLNGPDTAKVTDMSGVFHGCTALTAVDVSSFNTSKVTDMTAMFSGCSSLESIDVSTFNTSNVTNIRGMFLECSSLKDLKLGGFNTSNVTNMMMLFAGCTSLVELDLSGFNTAKTEYFLMMFSGCNNLEKLNLSNFTIPGSTNAGWMFNACSSLQEIILNQSVLNATADLLLEISTVWYHKTLGTSYNTADALKKITGKVTLVRYESDVDLSRNISYSHTLTLQNNLSINYYVSAAALEGYDSIQLCVEKDTYDKNGNYKVTTEVLTGEVVNVGYGPEYKFRYTGIASYEVGNEIRAYIVAKKNGETCTFSVDTYSVKSYCYNQLKKSSSTAKLKKLIVDLLNYCSLSQQQFGIRTNALVNADLTAAQKAYGSTSCKTLTSKASETVVEGATATISGKTLVLGNNVELKVYMKLPTSMDKSKVTLRIVYKDMNDTSVIKNIPFSEFAYDKNTNEYSVRYAEIMAPEFRNVLNMAIYNGSTKISNVHKYSIETYAYNRVNSTTSTELMKKLVKAMMMYSDSAVEYFAK